MSKMDFNAVHAHATKMEKLKQARIKSVFNLIKLCGVATPVSTAKLSSYENFDYDKFAKLLSENYSSDIKSSDLTDLTIDGVIDLVGRYQLEENMKYEIAQQEDEELERMLAAEESIADSIDEGEKAPIAPENIQQPSVTDESVPPVSEINEDSDEDEDDFEEEDEVK